MGFSRQELEWGAFLLSRVVPDPGMEPWSLALQEDSILKEISPEYSLEGLMLKLQYFGHRM